MRDSEVVSFIRPSDKEAEKKRDESILLRAGIVYLLTSGGIGVFLSGIGITYDALVFNLAVLLIAMYFAYFYRTKKKENVGAVLFFIVFAVGIFLFRDYVNSGFYAIVNRTTGCISDYFNTKGMKTYSERIADRRLTVTAFSVIWAAVLEFFLMSSVVYRAGYLLAAVLTLLPNLFIFYMRLECAPAYMAELLTGLTVTFALRASGHYRLSRADSGYEKTKHGFTYGNAPKCMAQTVAFAAAISITVSFVGGAVAKSFDQSAVKSPIKKSGEETVKNALLLGFDGIFNRYPTTGGLNSGRLGGVSQLRNDNQPDLEVEFVPYTQQSVYLRGFVFDKYNPRQNCWTISEPTDTEGLGTETASLKKKYDAGDGSRGLMQIKNVGAPSGNYLPYYSTSESGKHVVYYPATDKAEPETEKKSLDKKYLAVPSEDMDSIRRFCRKAGLTEGMNPEKAVVSIQAYFQKNYPYTLKPGATPNDKDFVEYFLDTNKKGYCAHFASAAVLTLRYIGIPARYCEGYRIDFERIAETADAESDKKYSDYFSGYNELGKTGVVKVEVPDTSAHAWVEIYEDGKGWSPAEVTPASRENNDGGGILSAIYDLFSGNSSSQSTGATADTASDSGQGSFERVSDSGVRIFFLMIVILALSPLIIMAAKKLRRKADYRKAFSRADNAGKAVLYYHRAIEKRRRKDAHLRELVNYRQQADYLFADLPDKDRQHFQELMNIAEFSGKNITDDEYKWLVVHIQLVKRTYKNDLFSKKC